MSKRCLKGGADPFPPYQYYNYKNEVVGSDYKLVSAPLEKAGYDIKVVIDEWGIIEGMLSRKELDFGFQVQKTPEREKKYFFSKLLRNATTEVITGNDKLSLSSFSEIADKNLKLGVMRGYSYGQDVDNLPAELKVPYETGDRLLKDIEAGHVDLGIFDKGVKEYIMREFGIKSIYSIDNLTFVRPLYVVFNDEKVRNDFDANF